MENSNNNFKAIIYVLLGMTVFAIQDTFIKLISNEVNLYLIYFTRCIIGLILILSYLKFKKIKIVFRTHYPFLTIIMILLTPNRKLFLYKLNKYRHGLYLLSCFQLMLEFF